MTGTQVGRAGLPALLAEATDRVVAFAATAVSLVAIVTMFGALCAEVIVRYVTRSSLGWPTELPNFMFPWLVMGGIVLAPSAGPTSR